MYSEEQIKEIFDKMIEKTKNVNPLFNSRGYINAKVKEIENTRDYFFKTLHGTGKGI